MVSAAVARYFHSLESTAIRFIPQKCDAKKPKSFGVFLGEFANPPTTHQICLLSQWDVVVLDPLQVGVLDAISSPQCTSAYILGRLDVEAVVQPDHHSGDAAIIRSLGVVAHILMTSFKRPQDEQSRFTGVLLAGWQTHFPPVVCGELVKSMSSLGLDVYLEISPPTFLTGSYYRGINMDHLRGMVCRNGTILPGGEKRDFFQMADMQTAMRAAVAQSCLRSFVVMMWETVDDDVELSHAVAKRSFAWCHFYSAISWIGSRAALTDAKVATTEIMAEEPLGAFAWLKNDEVMKAHEIWRSNEKICQGPCGDRSIFDSLELFIPNLTSKLSVVPLSNEERTESPVARFEDFDWTSLVPHVNTNPLSFSRRGADYTGLGCFPLGFDCSPNDFTDLVQSQRRLRELGLLDPVAPDELRRIGEQLHALHNNTRSSLADSPDDLQVIEELAELLCQVTGNDEDNNRLRVYVGLDSGFRNASDVQFWGLYDFDSQLGTVDIYISKKVRDLPGTILHSFMSSRNCTRSQCFMAEIALAKQTGCLTETFELAPRLLQDIEMLSPEEILVFLQHLSLSKCEESSNILAMLRSCCEYQLMEVPSLAQLKALSTTAYIRGEISAEDLVASRLEWYRERGCQHPDPDAAISLFLEIEVSIMDALKRRQSQQLEQLTTVLRSVLRKNKIDSSLDLFALSVFCAIRKLAFEEVYMEVTDRNPLFGDQCDQAAAFAELFALGSRCESYFGVTPSVFGKMLSDKYRLYYNAHQPPPSADDSTVLATAYAAAQIDVDPDADPAELPWYSRFTFLSVFAIPALVDILLLTTTGRGLYLSAYMSQIEQQMATLALMISLILSGAIGSWISYGGSYYLVSMAFSAMNMFALTRFIAGMAFCLASGLLAFVLIGITKGFLAGLIFFLYLLGLTSYLSVLVVLATYQFPGFSFQSGRTVIVVCIPVLFVSPIVTLWIRHDVAVYLSVLYGFVTSLLLGSRRIISQWSTWHLKVPTVTDNDILNWYITTKASGDSGALAGMTDPAAMRLAQKTLLADVLKERSRLPWTKSMADGLVLQLAKGYTATMFLFDWYCKYSNTKMPLPYSSTWNIQSRVALDTLRRAQKGIKLHNGFVHWRRASGEVGCGVLYFVVALLDKWVELISGGKLVGLSAATNETFRMAVGFGLAYYLVGAVILDVRAQTLHEQANQITHQPITSVKFLQQAAINDARAKRKLYWSCLIKFFFIHVWGLSVTAAFIWSFDSSRDAMVMFLSYVGAYTGLLWYQYSRIFTGPRALKDLVIAVIIGLPVGLVMHHFQPLSAFNSVIALAIATWTAAILSLWTADIGIPRFSDDANAKTPPVFHSNGALGLYPELSQRALSELFGAFYALPAELRYRLDPRKYPGVEVMTILMCQSNACYSGLVLDAFPEAEQLVDRTAELWKNGKIVIDLVPARHPSQPEQAIRAVSRTMDDQLHVLVGVDLDFVGGRWAIDIHRNCKVIAEALIYAAAESKLGLSRSHSILAELLVTSYDNEEELSIPDGIKRQLERSSFERTTAIKCHDKELLRHLCFGRECDRDWDNLPRTVRSLLLKRCYGEPCYISDSQLRCISSTFCRGKSLDLETYVARCNLSAVLTILVGSFATALDTDRPRRGHQPQPPDSSYQKCMSISGAAGIRKNQLIDYVKLPIHWVYHVLGTCIKFFAISLIADPEFQRELDHVMSGKISIIRWPATLFLNAVWIYCSTLQRIMLPFFLFHGRESVSRLFSDMKGVKTVIGKHKVVVESLDGPSTAFVRTQSDGGSKLYQYSGRHDREPEGHQNLVAINTYTDKLVLCRREEYAYQSLVNEFSYEYHSGSSARDSRILKTSNPKLAIGRRCVQGKLEGQLVQYDNRGFITSGSAIKDGNLLHFKFWYRKNARFDDELLRAEYVFPHISVKVSWCAPPPRHPEKSDRWIPHSKVMEATFIQGADKYESKWEYDHKFHPAILTTLNGRKVATPPMIQFDWLDVLKKPKNCSFVDDNPLFSFSSVNMSFISRLLGFNTHRFRISTSRARSHLWKSWRDGIEFDGVIVRWLDETALRSDRVLKKYWSARDMGRLQAGEDYLNSHADTIMASVDIDREISSWTPLAFKMSDFYSFGQGGDAVINTRTRSSQLRDSDNELHVLATDTGTWPNEGGGVSACRRDMIDSLQTIKWHMVVEAANDFGLPKYQIEQNIQSLKVVPLWGLDFLTPTHGIFQNCLDSMVQEKSQNTRDADIANEFIPILTSLVRGARAVDLDRSRVEEVTKTLVDMNTYFESSRHWSAVWDSDIVKDAWRELWLTEDMSNVKPLSEWFDAERPTLSHLDQALELWYRYLFIFSIPVPEEIPDVFQASHHSVSASYGIVCKVKRQCTLQIWDHAISWRETNLYLSSALCFLPPFVRNSLLGLMRLTSVLVLNHADIVLPCADFFNPGWETEIGTCQGTLQHRRVFHRKIDPVVNGICDMERFKPIEEVKTKVPTVTMLSHVWYAKDIKTAILAADIIVNEWGFNDYHLDIYGDLERAPTYSTECQEIIASKSLRGNVALKGTANPVTVLEDTWLFMNSSVSEGLPLAIGEAALTGVPVICTDVGASLRVLTDPENSKCFSAIVAPNDVRSLARSQVNLLALLDEWSEFAGDGEPCPKLSSRPTREEVDRITKRMYEKSEQRRRLGMMSRSIVQKSFAGDRYLREHEQMLWIGKYRSERYRNERDCAETGTPTSNDSPYSTEAEKEAKKVPHQAIRTKFMHQRKSEGVDSRMGTHLLTADGFGYSRTSVLGMGASPYSSRTLTVATGSLTDIELGLESALDAQFRSAAYSP
ncbi:hypothetical protein FGG08_005700 [Glutinoglossum americanum]|uniref:Glycosyl transferase n=1 Tax=Glutinoglossum americanum TaxID=1670608 RepID=A0A9P8HZV0_9PEZI|nr:hypothetical protein FGG08_005700 [Glutinoglossum americanum]